MLSVFSLLRPLFSSLLPPLLLLSSSSLASPLPLSSQPTPVSPSLRQVACLVQLQRFAELLDRRGLEIARREEVGFSVLRQEMEEIKIASRPCFERPEGQTLLLRERLVEPRLLGSRKRLRPLPLPPARRHRATGALRFVWEVEVGTFSVLHEIPNSTHPAVVSWAFTGFFLNGSFGATYRGWFLTGDLKAGIGDALVGGTDLWTLRGIDSFYYAAGLSLGGAFQVWRFSVSWGLQGFALSDGRLQGHALSFPLEIATGLRFSFFKDYSASVIASLGMAIDPSDLGRTLFLFRLSMRVGTL